MAVTTDGQIGEEPGTVSEDRSFRPDIEGLRAVAVLLVVFDHAGVAWLTGGFIGVDVFFVISGFVITGLLLRRVESTGRLGIADFYGRRMRRIVPAASLVIIVTVIASRVFVGVGAAQLVEVSGRWSSAFIANFQPAVRNVLTAPPNPLSAYWSLAVEEQFYLIYPALFLVILNLRRWSLRTRLGILLGAVGIASFSWSVVSSADSIGAYISPFTRAWELAVGGLLALGVGWAKKLPPLSAATITWMGFVVICVSASFVRIQASTGGYPGYIALLPVVAAALIIAGGSAAPPLGVESILQLSPFKWIGRWSFALYLVHYPILIVAFQHYGHMTLPENLGLVGLAIAASALIYFAIENPIRNSERLRKSPLDSVLLGFALIALTVVVTAVV